MRKMRLVLTALTGAALVAGSIAPAAARDHRGWDNRGWDRGWHRRDRGLDFGDAVGIAALIGAVAVVATSMSKDRKARSGTSDADRPYGDADTRNPDYNGDQDYQRDQGDDRVTDNALASEDAAVNACAVAARDEATTQGGYAEVRRVDAPRAVSGGWDVDGQVERRDSYRGPATDVRRFTCSIRNGRVAEIYISKDGVTA